MWGRASKQRSDLAEVGFPSDDHASRSATIGAEVGEQPTNPTATASRHSPYTKPTCCASTTPVLTRQV